MLKCRMRRERLIRLHTLYQAEAVNYCAASAFFLTHPAVSDEFHQNRRCSSPDMVARLSGFHHHICQRIHIAVQCAG